MSLFYLACAALLVLASSFVLFPRRERPVDADVLADNVDWYRRRRQELGDDDLEEDARLRLLEDAALAPAGTAAPVERRFPLWVLPPLLLLTGALLYWQLGSLPDLKLAERLDALDETATEGEVDALVEDLARRARQRPGNLSYLGILGQFYFAQERFEEAEDVYRRIVDRAPEDARALALAAQASYLADSRQLGREAQMFAEQALAINPEERTALGLLGMAAYEAAEYRAALTYWERLRDLEAPGSQGEQMLASVIETARERLESAQAGGVTVDTPAAQAAGAGVVVSIDLPEAADIEASSVVFVLARQDGAASRMPIAVQRISAGALPTTVRLDDSSTMAGQSLASAGRIRVFVQVSPSGQPGEQNATWLGESGPIEVGAQPVAATIMLRARDA